MIFNDLHFLSRASGIVQIAAIALVFLSGYFQISKFLIEKRIANLKGPITKEEKSRIKATIAGIVLVFLGGLLLLLKVCLEVRITNQKGRITEEEKSRFRATVAGLEATIFRQAKEISAVRKEVSPRIIPNTLFNELRRELSAYPGEKLGIMCLMADSEAFAFASQLKELFKSAGWSVDGVAQGQFTIPPRGTILQINNGNDPALFNKAKLIRGILNRVTVPSTNVTVNPRIGGYDTPNINIEILVGHKD